MTPEKLLRLLKRTIQRQRLHRHLKSADPLKVIVGAASSSYEGWYATDRDLLDIRSASDWKRLFRPASIDRLLAEHVLEHLSEAECRTALQESFHYLKVGGLFRIAVPDGYRRDTAYLEEVRPPKDGHKMLFTIDTLLPLLHDCGFHSTALEFFDAQERFHHRPWDSGDGSVQRSYRFDRQKDFKRGELYYTSLIVDARKP
ncbi:hypothetical protein CSB45_06320 [candidate division KSB3 bacterium]|uniref:Methyltransferase type 11 domain-containing protein n=1 Tax=candidate division KSB3 bacterium TaxID=2044937 RepID=A0A2G6E7G7_9BACT|nr:MAG: hypothetical protein CSB45_06320 [candidate division KSB3 bacterium]PIE30258.1 MAG: hypothetical protein CSA57_05035 [candidate division KSB3 bacterium]